MEERKNNRVTKATTREMEAYRHLAGEEMIWVGSGTMPQEAVIGSMMQQRMARLTVGGLIDTRRIVKDLKEHRPMIFFMQPTGTLSMERVMIKYFSHAPFNIYSIQSYGQTGIITVIVIADEGGAYDIYHAVDWTSCKQRRISDSSYGAEILLVWMQMTEYCMSRKRLGQYRD